MSLFKRLLNRGTEDAKSPGMPPGTQAVGVQLQRRFTRGVQYNMKIVIRGDNNVGKTCLFQRIQGQKFKEEYVPTEEIQVTSIQWNYNATNDVVKVEVWDVTDKGKKRRKMPGLKMDNSEIMDAEEPDLDSEPVDVYKGAHGVVFVFDITKQWTFTYVEREMEKVPSHLPVLILGNHRDMGHHRSVTEERARYFVEQCLADRHEGCGKIRYAESSMRNGFGLKYLYAFFNLPFLQLQRDRLLSQLETNTNDIVSTVEELVIHKDSEEQNYDMYLQFLAQQRRELQDKLSEDAASTQERPVTSAAMVGSSPINTSNCQMFTSQSHIVTSPSQSPSSGSHQVERSGESSQSLHQLEHTVPSARGSLPETSTPATTPQTESQGMGIFSRFFKKNRSVETSVSPPMTLNFSASEASQTVKNVDDFVPDADGVDSGFLDDSRELPGTEDESVNEMVTVPHDDLDSGDETASSAGGAITSKRQNTPSETLSNNTAADTTSRDSASLRSNGSDDVPGAATPAVRPHADLSSDEEVATTPTLTVSPVQNLATHKSITSPFPPSQKKTTLISAADVEVTDSDDEITKHPDQKLNTNKLMSKSLSRHAQKLVNSTSSHYDAADDFTQSKVKVTRNSEGIIPPGRREEALDASTTLKITKPTQEAVTDWSSQAVKK
ncbi:unnamed protein product, partial [Candidula unifasciata]